MCSSDLLQAPGYRQGPLPYLSKGNHTTISSIKPQSDREAAIQKGYSMLEAKMLSSIKEIGVRVTETKGRKFDSHLHEVVREVGTHEHAAGTVIDEIKRGYTLGDRVLRLAQVHVAIASSFR